MDGAESRRLGFNIRRESASRMSSFMKLRVCERLWLVARRKSIENTSAGGSQPRCLKKEILVPTETESSPTSLTRSYNKLSSQKPCNNTIHCRVTGSHHQVISKWHSWQKCHSHGSDTLKKICKYFKLNWIMFHWAFCQGKSSLGKTCEGKECLLLHISTFFIANSANGKPKSSFTDVVPTCIGQGQSNIQNVDNATNVWHKKMLRANWCNWEAKCAAA